MTAWLPVLGPALTALLALLLVPLLLAAGVLLLQVIAWRPSPPRQAPAAPPAARPRLAILVPAHNESAVIEGTLRTLLPQLRQGDRLVVVADNCSDDTAALARALGAEVVERTHATERGKGFALARGLDALRADPPALVLLVDADCDLQPGAVDALAAAQQRLDRPIQALYLMLAPAVAGARAPLKRRLAEFAWRVRNDVRPGGWHRLGLPCQLMGTGMAFSWAQLRDAPLANASIVEDMQLGLDLARQGLAPRLCPEAVVLSWFPQADAAAAKQRTRWEHGHLDMIRRELPTLLAAAWRRRDLRLAGLALDLMVPPLALLMALLSAAAVAALLNAWLQASPAARGLAWVAVAGPLLVLAAVALAWARRGRDLVSGAEWLRLPAWLLGKLPIYLRFLTRRQQAWERTDRDGGPGPGA